MEVASSAANCPEHPPEGGAHGLVAERTRRGRCVLVEADGTIWVSHHLALLRSRDDGVTWQRAAALPTPRWRRAIQTSRLACRLLRHEVRALAALEDGTLVAADRRGIYVGRAGTALMAPSRVAAGPLPLLPPLCIGTAPGGRVVFGEYGSPRPKRPMRIFASSDGGHSFAPVHAFGAGEILHVHNVVWDAGRAHWWVLTGDFDPEPGIGILSADLRRFEWLARGEQRFRAVAVFDAGDRLVYATDSQLECNALISLDKDSGRTERLRPFDGSCIYACRFGGLFALSTTVEPSSVNRSPFAELWVSRDLDRWHRVLAARKDRWDADWFQFGSLVLPRGESGREVLAVSGQAVERLDGRVWIGRLEATNAEDGAETWTTSPRS